MRRIGSKKLTLHKETLRTLTGTQLGQVAGATTFVCVGSIQELTVGQSGCTLSPGGGEAGSKDAIGCAGPSIPHITHIGDPPPIIIIVPGAF